MVRMLITGGSGFIGHHVVERFMHSPGYEVTILDRLDFSGNQNRLKEIGAPGKCRFVYHDLKSPINEQLANQIGRQDIVVHIAAATHVDRSITDPMSFVQDNVVGTCNILDYARSVNCEHFVYFGTDEVFGPAPPGTAYKEDDRYNCGNPYSATKSGAEQLCVSYDNTYGLPVSIIHCMNVFGERQNPEKFIPLTVAKVLNGDIVQIHSDPTGTIPGSRFYLHARCVADALDFILSSGSEERAAKYNVVGEVEVDNLQLAKLIAQYVGKKLNYEMVDFHSSRPGHDLRYALDGTKLERMGWRPPVHFEQALKETVLWTLDNPHWLTEPIPIEERDDSYAGVTAN